MDGRVEILAIGSEGPLDEYCESLKRGPTFSQVREVLVKTMDETEVVVELSVSGFMILPDLEMK
jgi:acylphosphatase